MREICQRGGRRVTLPKDVLTLMATLARAGHRAYAVGGCVRDALRGAMPDDWDLCTDALPDEVAACFPAERVLPTGIQHGTVTVLIDHRPYEITTFRVDGTYRDHRRPDSVRFVCDLHADLGRRDFTINAMAYHPDEGLIDPFGGQADLHARVVRCVGAPWLRFGEDALRILRALRFAAVLGFTLDKPTAQAAQKRCASLRHVAVERVRVELDKLLCGADAAPVLRKFPDIVHTIAPQLCCKAPDWAARTDTLAQLPSQLPLRLAALLVGVDSEQVAAYFASLRYDARTAEATQTILAAHALPLTGDAPTLLNALRRTNPNAVRGALLLCGAQGAEVAEAQALLERLLLDGACYRAAQLAVGGKDLLALGISPGPEVGRILSTLLDAVIAGEVVNEKSALLANAAARVERS